MNTRNRSKSVLTLAAAVMASLVFTSTSTHAATIAAGDVIKLDLSNSGDGDGGSLADWNQLSTDGTIGSASVIRHGDGATVSGVTITLAGRSGNNNDGNASGWGGIGTDPYYIAAADDIVYSIPGPMSVTFGGLDNALDYNVRVYALINEGLAPYDIDVTDGAGTISRTGLVRSTLFATVPLSSDLIFSGVSTDGSGNMVVSLDSTQPFALNAVVLEANVAVPEPSALLLTITASLAFMGLALRRRRCNR